MLITFGASSPRLGEAITYGLTLAVLSLDFTRPLLLDLFLILEEDAGGLKKRGL
jgi:hypothetical protein